MSNSLPTIIWRHRKENLNKCSLKNLESRKDLIFLTYPKDDIINISNYLIITMDAPPLTEEEKEKGLFFIDATWKYAEVMRNKLIENHSLKFRSLPNIYKTAYPRKQTACPDPEYGLATIEALYVSYKITQRAPEGLLDFYHFKNQFLKLNSFSC